MNKPLLIFAAGCIVASALLVGTLDYDIAKKQEIQLCKCKSEIKEKQLYASLCQSGSIMGPWYQECLYK